MVQMKSEGSVLENFRLLRETILYVLANPPNDWAKSTHIMEDEQLY